MRFTSAWQGKIRHALCLHFSKPGNIHRLPLPCQGFYAMIIDTHCHLASAQFDQSRREAYVEHLSLIHI